MEIGVLFFILKTYSFLWFLIILFSFPFLLFINKKNQNYLYILPILGLSTLLLFLNWFYYLNLLNYLNYINKILYIFLIILIIFTLILIKEYKFLLIKYLKILIFNYFFNFLLLYFFIYFQGGFNLPYIPSYEVNHDPIIILTTAKSLLLKVESSLENIGMMSFLDLSRGNYPISFVLFLYLVGLLLKQDFYNITHLINIFIYLLTFLPFIKLLEELIPFKNKNVYLFASIFSIFSYLGIQVVNQSFYNQVMLLPFMICSIYFIIKAFKDSKNSNLILFLSISLIGIILSYSFTGLIWLIILICFLIILSITSNLKEAFENIIFLLKSILITILLIFPNIFNALNMFYLGLFSNSREGSFLKALGNTLGYPSFFVAFNTWPILDFRINEISKIFLIFCIIFTLSLIIFSFIGYLKSKTINKKNIFNLLVLILVFSIPVFILRVFFTSPYYYSKTLFYASFIYSALIGLGLILCFMSFKNLIIRTIIIIMFLIYFNNSMRSINYFGRPPILKFEELKNYSNFFKNKNIKIVTLIDDEDWAKYFLFDQGACVVFARTFSCNIGYKKIDNEKIALDSNSVNYYLVGNKYKDIVVNLNEAELIQSGNYYSLYFLK